MGRICYPGVAHHKVAHKDLLTRFTALKQRFERGDQSARARTVRIFRRLVQGSRTQSGPGVHRIRPQERKGRPVAGRVTIRGVPAPRLPAGGDATLSAGHRELGNDNDRLE